ncbi:MAG TPA: APC family permease [Polyangiaceae bacterium]|nr:APC family permease [Polyangiaceae bacterium]
MWKKIRAFLFGAPKDVRSEKTFHAISLVAMLAWVGLGADGLSSSAYGPDAAFREIMTPGHDYSSLAVFLALGTALTVFVISYAYSRIIEHFPSGGGGYVVATKLLGPRFGVVSGSALLVDYVLTITVSIAAGGEAVFYLVPRAWFGPSAVALAPDDIGTWLDPVQRTKVLIELVAIALLVILNIRGVKESVATIAPIFAAFVLTHAVLLVVAIGGHVGDFGAVSNETIHNLHATVGSLGIVGVMALTVRAYSLGGGTYTGIEAVSNGVPIMREPKARTAKRTMALMATSLSITAAGIILAYLLVRVAPDFDDPTKPMNAILLDKVFGAWRVGGWNAGYWFVLLALCSEAGLLFIAAQAGFVDGPRVMANMAIDSWLPHRFAALSERLSMQNGVMLMGCTSIAALVYTHGNVERLVVMYSINVFVTFSLSNLGMAKFWIQHRKEHTDWFRHLPVHIIGLALCMTILVVTSVVKFAVGGWLTIVVTGLLVIVCFWIKRHYNRVVTAIRRLDVELADPLIEASTFPKPSVANLEEAAASSRIDRRHPVAVLFVGGYGGLGRHALLTLLRMFPGHFKGIVFCSVAVIDSGVFKGIDEVHALEKRTQQALDKYVEYASWLGIPAESTFSTGIEVAVEAEKIATELIQKYPRGLFVAGQLIFEEETFFTRILHNETAFMIQRRLQHAGVPMIVLPVRLNLAEGPRISAPSLTEERPA